MSSISGRVKLEYQKPRIKSEHGYDPVKDEDTDDEGGLDSGKKEEDVNVASWASNLKKRKVYDMLEYAKPLVNKCKLLPSDPPVVVSNDSDDNTTRPERKSPHKVENRLLSSEPKEPTKKKRKRKKNTCIHEGCNNHVIKGGVCWTHGAKLTAKVKTCSHEGCTNIVQKRGVCIKHGAKV